MIKGMTWTNIKSVWNLSGLSDVPYSAKQNWSGTFFAVTYSKLALVENFWIERENKYKLIKKRTKLVVSCHVVLPFWKWFVCAVQRKLSSSGKSNATWRRFGSLRFRPIMLFPFVFFFTRFKKVLESFSFVYLFVCLFVAEGT